MGILKITKPDYPWHYTRPGVGLHREKLHWVRLNSLGKITQAKILNVARTPISACVGFLTEHTLHWCKLNFFPRIFSIFK